MSRVFARVTISALTIVAAFGVAGLLASASYAKEAPKQCKDNAIESTGQQRLTHGRAFRAATRAWSQEVDSKYGPEWTDFDLAKDTTTRCFRAQPNAVGYQDWQCAVSGVPCRVGAETKPK